MCAVHQKRADDVHDGWFSCYFEPPFRWFQLSILPLVNRSRVRLTLHGSLRKVNLSFGQKRLSFGRSLTIGNNDVTFRFTICLVLYHLFRASVTIRMRILQPNRIWLTVSSHEI